MENLEKLLWDGKILPSTYYFLRTKRDEGRLTPSQFSDLIINEFLGENWYITDPVDQEIVLDSAFECIVGNRTHKFNKRKCRKYQLKFTDVSIMLRGSNIELTEEEILYIAHKTALLSLIKNKKERNKKLTELMFKDKIFAEIIVENHKDIIRKKLQKQIRE